MKRILLASIFLSSSLLALTPFEIATKVKKVQMDMKVLKVLWRWF